MPESKSAVFNPYNPQTEEESNLQIAQIGSFKIAFRTMPQDLKFLTGKQEQPGLLPLEKIKSESINIIGETPTETPLPVAQQNDGPAFEIDQELKRKTKIKFENLSQEPPASALKIEKSEPKTAAASYKEGKLLYNRALYGEAIEKFIETLNAKPNHWRAKWYLNRAKNKLSGIQKNLLNSQQSEEIRKKELAEELKREQEKQKQIIAKLKTEAQAKKEAEAKAKIEAESREKISKELELMEQEKSAAIDQTRQAQTDLEKIRKEAEEKAKQEFSQKIQIEKERINKEQEARRKLEAELVIAEQEKKKMEEEIALERELLLKSQQAVTEQLAAMSQPEAPISQSSPPEQAAPAFFEQTFAPSAYVPPPIIPIPKIEETKISAKAKIAELIKIVLASKTTKIIGLSVGFIAVAAGFVYFTGLYKIFSSAPQPAQPEIRQEEVLPVALFTINQTETIILKAGQKKNLFYEINKIAEKSLLPGSFTRILVKFINEDQQQKYASLTDLIDSLQIVFPSEVLSNMDGNYTLFLCSQNETLDSPFLESLGGNKLGLVMTFRESNKIINQFINWQQTIATDLDALFLGKKISFGSNYQFQEFSYNGVLIHSLDLPNQYSSLNYAFINNKALITTSLESAKNLIDRLIIAK